MPKITNLIATRLSIAGHCIRHNEEAANNLMFWEPKGKRKQGRCAHCAVTFVDNLKEYTDLEIIDDIRNVMMRDV